MPGNLAGRRHFQAGQEIGLPAVGKKRQRIVHLSRKVFSIISGSRKDYTTRLKQKCHLIEPVAVTVGAAAGLLDKDLLLAGNEIADEQALIWKTPGREAIRFILRPICSAGMTSSTRRNTGAMFS